MHARQFKTGYMIIAAIIFGISILIGYGIYVNFIAVL